MGSFHAQPISLAYQKAGEILLKREFTAFPPTNLSNRILMKEGERHQLLFCYYLALENSDIYVSISRFTSSLSITLLQ